MELSKESILGLALEDQILMDMFKTVISSLNEKKEINADDLLNLPNTIKCLIAINSWTELSTSAIDLLIEHSSELCQHTVNLLLADEFANQDWKNIDDLPVFKQNCNEGELVKLLKESQNEHGRFTWAHHGLRYIVNRNDRNYGYIIIRGREKPIGPFWSTHF